MRDFCDCFGVYVHVPFCAKPCGYCRFYKKIPTGGDLDFYLDTLSREVSVFENSPNFSRRPDTAFFGGGTPSVFSPAQIDRIGAIFEKIKPEREWTVEVSPSSITREKLERFKAIGVSRISLGVQSFSEKTLKSLSRAHSLAETLRAVDAVAQCNFRHFSIDLMFGAQGQTAAEFEADLRRAAALPVDHISAYCLEFESGTSSCAGKKPDDWLRKNSSDAELFELAMQVLPECGFAQYEISNYARSEQDRCLHNVCTWNMASWLGFGPAAASQFCGRRFRNNPSLRRWADGVNSGVADIVDVVDLDDGEMFSSALIFGLRMNCGVDFESLKRRFPAADFARYAAPIETLVEEGLLERRGERLCLTAEGRLYADSVAVELL